jgi:hypothetical protein
MTTFSLQKEWSRLKKIKKIHKHTYECDVKHHIPPTLFYFSYIMATSFSGGRSWTTRREPPTMGKQLNW